MRKNIVIIGAGSLGLCVANILEQENKYRILGFYDDKPKPKFPYPVLGKVEELKHTLGIVAIGDNFQRFQVLEKIKKQSPDFRQINAIHPSALIANKVKIGKGIIIDAGVIIGNFSEIHDNVLLLSGAVVEHENLIEEFASLAPGSITGGNVRIGKFSAVGLGAKIVRGITLGEHSVLGAGSLLLQNLGDFKVAYGCPAKEIRTRKKGEKYL